MNEKVVVVGGGIAGLAAALRLRERLGPAAEITVYEQRGALGGKLRTGTAGGLVAERGADAFLTRAPGRRAESAAIVLARRVGLGAELVHPEPVPAGLWLDGALHPFPPGTLLGVPGDLERVAAVARPEPERDRDQGRPLLAPGEDLAVGELVRRRLGDQVADRLVDPMLGGVYAGRSDALSLAATMPGLAAACRTETTLAGAVRAALAAAPRPAGTPVFASIRGGLSRLVEAVASASGARFSLGRPVRELAAATPGMAGPGWRLVVGSTRDPEQVPADGVVLALPARPAARLLHGVASASAELASAELASTDLAAAELIGRLDYASVALVTLVLPAAVALPEWSGFLVPAAEGTLVKAVTFVTRKWAHRRREGDPLLVRASVGRYGEPEPLRLSDPALAEQVHKELSHLLGGLPPMLDAQVHRWGGALPQYAPGHLDRVATARARLPATIRLAGAGYDGVGIPACVQSGQDAADQLADAWG